MEGLSKSLKESKRVWFDDEMLKNGLNKNGYDYKKHRDSKGNEYGENVWINREDEKEYITNRQLTNTLNEAGFFKDKTFNMWTRNNEKGKDKLSSLYVNEIANMGNERYCGYEDEYIDNSWTRLDVAIHDDLIEELTECADERGLPFDLYLEYILLKQLEKERPRKRNRIIKQYLEDEWECNEEEIKFIMELTKFEEFIEGEAYYYLDIFHYEYLKSQGYTEQQLNFIFRDVELPQHYYHCQRADSNKSFYDIRCNENFEIEQDYENADILKYVEDNDFMLTVKKMAIEFIK
ncbi:MAG: hypothetical protein RSB12_07065 [Peptostreptococcaceae bacterium]